ncbi:M56 family metallopeptidase [Schlesneria paludicola]|uniref:M56 family metallopeptidase n=1 Tax=Schlesneria paludicola TaxID=360056 RepID=UPI00029A1412|nr:M56 family metallopeptidase [Schlesneria paludicola]
MHIDSLKSGSGVLLLNIVVASIVVAGAGLLLSHLVRRMSLPIRHGVLTVTLMLTVATPLPSWLASTRDLGLLTVRQGDTSRSAMALPVKTPATQQIKLADALPRDTGLVSAESTPNSSGALSQARLATSPAGTQTPVPGWKWLKNWDASDVGVWLILIWCAGMFYLTLQLARGLLVVQHLRRTLKPATNPRLLAAAKTALAASGLSETTPIYESRLAPAPLTLGWWRCAIVVPEGVVETLDETQLVYVLAHEAAHIHRHDTLFAFFQQMTEIVLWWNLFVRRLNGRIHVLREQICDDHVVKHWGDGRPLAHAIVKVAEWSSVRAVRLPLVAPLFDDFDAIEQRITRLTDSDRAITLRLNVATAMMVTAIGMSLAGIPFVPLMRTERIAAAADDIVDDGKSNWEVRVQIIDEDGQPIASPRIGMARTGDLADAEWHVGDADGQYTLTFPNRHPRYLYLYARAPGYAPMRAFWGRRGQDSEDPLPEEFTFQMSKSTSVGGVVLNPNGQPLEGATVRFSAGDHRAGLLRRAESSFNGETYVTDKDGKWRCDLVPPGTTSTTFSVTHPDFATNANNYSVDHQMDQLRQFKHTWKLRPIFDISGRVVDEDGKPVAGAALVLCELNGHHSHPIQITDQDGQYRFRAVSQSQYIRDTQSEIALTISIVKPGYQPVFEKVPGFGRRPLANSTEKQRIVDFTLSPGVTLSFRVVDGEGRPVQNAWINYKSWRNTDALSTLQSHGLPERTDENGLYQWTDAPPGDVIEFDVEAKGFARVINRKIKFDLNGNDETIVMTRPQVLVGSVIDAVTKQPIENFVFEKAFENVGGYADGLYWAPSEGTIGKAGRYRATITMTPSQGRYTYRVRADGYEAAVSKSTPFQEGETEINFELKRSDEAE